MATALSARATNVLRGAGLFTAVLALVAGILGMHVITVTHAEHSALAAPAVSVQGIPASGDGHAAGHNAGHSAGQAAAHVLPEAPDGGITAAARCTELGCCTGMQASAGSCIPSAKSASLAAPLPGTVVTGWNPGSGRLTAGGPQWSYQPGSPSPGDFGISRT